MNLLLYFVVVALVNNFKNSYVQWSLPITFALRLLPFSKSTLGITVFESLHGIQKAITGANTRYIHELYA
jgi:hypothetical protein